MPYPYPQPCLASSNFLLPGCLNPYYLHTEKSSGHSSPKTSLAAESCIDDNSTTTSLFPRLPDRQSRHPPTATMATELTVQAERAFQKQPHIFLNSKVKVKTARAGKAGRRWYKDVGLGFKTPKTAIEGTYIGMSMLWILGSKKTKETRTRKTEARGG